MTSAYWIEKIATESAVKGFAAAVAVVAVVGCEIAQVNVVDFHAGISAS